MHYTNNRFEIQMSTGSKYPSFSLTVYEFVPLSEDVTSLEYMKSPVALGLKSFSRTYAPPISLYQYDQKKLKEKCLKHIEAVGKMPRDVREHTRGDMSPVVIKLIDIITEYHQTIDPDGKVILTYAPF